MDEAPTVRRLFTFSADTTFRDFMLEALNYAMQERGLEMTGSAVTGGAVIRYRVCIESIDLPYESQEGVAH